MSLSGDGERDEDNGALHLDDGDSKNDGYGVTERMDSKKRDDGS